jgi:hypothetical protein
LNPIDRINVTRSAHAILADDPANLIHRMLA